MSYISVVKEERERLQRLLKERQTRYEKYPNLMTQNEKEFISYMENRVRCIDLYGC